MKALFFDFDGLIVDTESPEVEAWSSIYNSFGLELPRSWWMQAIGRGADQEVEHPLDGLIAAGKGPLDIPDLEKKAAQYRIDALNHSETRPGILAWIAEAENMGLRLAVVSSSKRPWIEGHLARLSLSHHFEFICCANDVANTKPSPDLYVLALQKMGLNPTEAFALEDSPNGVKAARAAGLAVIAYPNPLTAQMDLSEATLHLQDLSAISIHECLERISHPSAVN